MSENKQPETIEEAVQYMFKELEPESCKLLKNTPKGDLMRLHRGYGMGVRNSLDLWDVFHPVNLQVAKIIGHLHPDSTSSYLTERLWEYLQTIELAEDAEESE
jgi:hypothetical protein